MSAMYGNPQTGSNPGNPCGWPSRRAAGSRSDKKLPIGLRLTITPEHLDRRQLKAPSGALIGTPTDLPGKYQRAELHCQSVVLSTSLARTELACM